MTNPRNEVTINLAGEERTMRATFGAIQNIERELGNIIPLIDRIAKGDVGVNQAATIIFFGLRGFEDTRLSKAEVGEAIVSSGLNVVMEPLVEFVTLTLKGSGEGKPLGAES